MKQWPRAVIVPALLLVAVSHTSARQTTAAKASAPRQELQAPPGWSATLQKTLDLELQGRVSEMVAIYEKWVADYPDFADAHAMLAGAHELLGRAALRSGAPDARNTSATQFEIAAVESRRAVDLTPPGNVTMTLDPLRGLIDLYGPAALNRPSEYERLVDEGLTRHPADPMAHAYRIRLLATQGKPIDRAVRAARAEIPKTASGRTKLASVLMAFVRDDGQGAAGPVAAAALRLVDEALTLDRNDIGALEQKAEILRNQARHAAEPERSALLGEEARVRAKAAELHHQFDSSPRRGRSDVVTSGESRSEQRAIGDLRAIMSAEATYAAVCGNGGYAISLEDLARPARGDGNGFITADLSSNGTIVHGYKITVARNARKDVTNVSTPAATCNGSKANPASSFFATAEPVDAASGDRFFAVDERGIIFYSSTRIPNPIVESTTVVRYR
jgi:hypothetical protein